MLAGRLPPGSVLVLSYIPSGEIAEQFRRLLCHRLPDFSLLFQFFFFRVKFFPYLVNVAGANVLCIEYRRKNNRASEIAYLFMMNVFGMNLNILNHRCT